jgi:hypothetical protein
MPLSAPILSVTDSADNTGGVATLTGGDAGATNTVYVQAVNGELGTSAWTSKGSRTGAGSVSVSAGAGFYWLKCVSVLLTETVVSNLVYQNFTTGAEAVMEQCLVAVQSRIQGLSLSGIANGSVVIRKVPDVKNVTMPAVFIAPLGSETVSLPAGSNLRDDVGYPVFVGIVANDNQDQVENRGRNLLWRQKVRRAFHAQRLTGVAEVFTCGIETRDIIAPDWFQAMRFVSAMIVRCMSREARGIS